MAVPFAVAKPTVTVPVAAGERVTLKVALTVPEFPSVTVTSLTDRAGRRDVVKVKSPETARLPLASRDFTR